MDKLREVDWRGMVKTATQKVGRAWPGCVASSRCSPWVTGACLGRLPGCQAVGALLHDMLVGVVARCSMRPATTVTCWLDSPLPKLRLPVLLQRLPAAAMLHPNRSRSTRST